LSKNGFLMRSAERHANRSSVSVQRDWSVRSIFTAFLVLVFFVQGYVAQTHIHKPPALEAGLAQHGRTAANAIRDHIPSMPSKGDEANCPVCQAFFHVGTFFLPPTVGLILPTQVFVVTISSLQAIRLVRMTAHSWHQRAPPVFAAL